jgi:BioD-like phosphotransacetylase family protein
LDALYITSPKEASGKTTIAAGIGQRLKKDGKKVGYLRVGGTDTAGADAAFMNKVLSLGESPEALISDAGAVKKNYDRVAAGKDSVIVEGDWEAAQAVVAALSARVIVVVSYDDKSIEASGYQAFGDRLAGVVLNRVPRNRLETASGSFSEGVKVLGVIPEDRVLLSLTVAELAEGIKGEILGAKDKSRELVSNFMLGITGLDRNPDYFGRKEAKAAILRSERPDLQLAALATPTSCLVLTGGGEVSPSVLDKAEADRVPVIRVTEETEAVIEALEAALAGTRFAQEEKLARLAEIMARHFDFSAL